MSESAFRERAKEGWAYLAAFFRRWLAGGANNDPLKGGPPYQVRWQWLREFDRVKTGMEQIKAILFSQNAKDLLLKRLKRDGKLQDGRCDFDYIHPHALGERKEIPEWQMWKEDYFQSQPVPSWKIWDCLLNVGDGVVDGLTASMGAFMIYALASGYAVPNKEKGGHTIFVEQVALVAWDTFNFDGDADDYHYWRCEPPDFQLDWSPGYRQLTNAPFRKFQTRFGHGSNFVVISGPEPVALAKAEKYDVSC